MAAVNHENKRNAARTSEKTVHSCINILKFYNITDSKGVYKMFAATVFLNQLYPNINANPNIASHVVLVFLSLILSLFSFISHSMRIYLFLLLYHPLSPSFCSFLPNMYFF